MVMMNPNAPVESARDWSGPPPSGLEETVPVLAYVNHGRWVGDCPAPGCNAAQMLHESGIYFCTECGNAAFSHKWLRVAWPSDAKEIALLLCNRQAQNQNWMPGEPLTELVKENMMHSIPPVL